MANEVNNSVPSQQSFAGTLFKIGSRFSLSQVFEDFLTMSIAACSINPETRLSWYEDQYLNTIDKYKDSDLRFEFPHAFSRLILEMEERVGGDLGNDVLGEFFEQHLSNGRNGQFFTPYPLCQVMATITNKDTQDDEKRPLRMLDPACGSGRLLLAAHRQNGAHHEYYGVDIDHTCVKISALNLFLNGVWNSEVMCSNSLIPNDFGISYRISLLPLGIFRIEAREQSVLWNLHRNSFSLKALQDKKDVLDLKPFRDQKTDNSSQLNLF
ncbi:MAG: N-6 DNA methylase [Bacteroidota bacterium]